MLACYHTRIPPDTRTVSEELRRRDRLDKIGGIPYLSDLVDSVPTSYHVEYYAKVVERTALLRLLIGAGGQIAAIGYDERDGDLEDTFAKAEQTLYAVTERRSNRDFVPISEVIDAYYERISYLQEHRSEVVGVPTGFRDLDDMLGGLQRSDLIILAARPSVGKTALCMSMAYNAAQRFQATVGIFSLEMSREQLVQRLLSMDTLIDTHKLRTGQLNERDLEGVIEAMGRLAALPIYIEDTPGQSITQVRSKARRLKSQVGCDLVIVDYLQLMISGKDRDNRVQEVSDISRGLKGLARELDVPVIAISQLSRAVEGRQSHVPMLSDLRESGCLPFDTLIFLADGGGWQPIGDLIGAHDGRMAWAMNPQSGAFEPRPITNAFNTGIKPIYRLQTSDGRVVRATANHPFWTPAGWRRLDQLQPGAAVAACQDIGAAAAWPTIASIVAEGPQTVCDITVAGHHNFLGGSPEEGALVLKNSIEQDADIVLFIYREELYDRETDKKGIAEVHIAKHRNGPVGVVPMRFDANITRFVDLTLRTPEGY